MNRQLIRALLTTEFSDFADGAIKRGCVTSLDDEQLKECHDGSICKICHGEMCNVKPTFQKCFTCNSQDEPFCATLQGELPETVCSDYLDTCKVYVKPNMTTHRGCFKEMLSDGIDCPPQANNCEQCSDNNCNGEIFPANRLSCFHCDGASAADDCYANLDGNQALSFPCETFYFRDFCYFYLSDDKAIHRGCMSDAVAYTEMCQNDPEKCRTCQSSNCNSASVMKAPQLSCIDCDTTHAVECLWGWPESKAVKCEKESFFYEEESCYVMSFDDQTLRGCTLDGNVCKGHPLCDLCSDGDACNRFNYVEQFCYECSSFNDQHCGPQPYHTNNITCPGVVQYEHRGCYTWTDAENNVRRGCFSDLDDDERTNCLADEVNCQRCIDEDNCNIEEKDSAGFITINLLLLVSMFVLSRST